METFGSCLYVYSKGKRRGKRGTKEGKKLLNERRKTENISFSFYLQVFVLVTTEM